MAGLGLAATAFGRAAAALTLGATPQQTPGPFFPEAFPSDMDNDLVRVTGKAAQAMGRVMHLAGNVVDPRGAPVEDAMIEIWQCDSSGKYNHSGDTQLRPFDGNFQGYGRTFTAGNGSYNFRTITPVPYDAPGIGTRAPHIHFKVAAEGFAPLTSQLYILGEPLNYRDAIFLSETPEDQQKLLVDLQDAPELEPDALKGTFRIVLKPL